MKRNPSVWCRPVVVPEQRLGNAGRAVCPVDLDDQVQGELLAPAEVGCVRDVGAQADA
jgi:hypothetical protein